MYSICFLVLRVAALDACQEKTYLSVLHNRNNNLTLACPITRNMAWKLVYVFDQLRLCFLGRCPTHTPAKCNDLACYLPLKRA